MIHLGNTMKWIIFWHTSLKKISARVIAFVVSSWQIKCYSWIQRTFSCLRLSSENTCCRERKVGKIITGKMRHPGPRFSYLCPGHIEKDTPWTATVICYFCGHCPWKHHKSSFLPSYILSFWRQVFSFPRMLRWLSFLCLFPLTFPVALFTFLSPTLREQR